MREIKFRAWDNERGIILPETINLYATGRIDFLYNGNYYRALDLMQYTGLKDRHGKEIYEGDIVKGHNFVEVVRHEGGGFSPFAVPGWEGTPSPEDVEIIGDIYENPDLSTSK